jgi:hypothetical protein
VTGSRIFISYRRGDSSAHAGRLADRLVAEFGEDGVFMDVDTIEPGADFVDYIDDAVGSCDVLIALIGDEWLDCRDDVGERRLDDPEDFVRLEVAAGLERDIRVVPVLVEGAVMPRAHELPEPLRRLARRNALEITDTRWRHDAGRLVETIKKVLAGRATGEAIREAEAQVAADPPPDISAAAAAPAADVPAPAESHGTAPGGYASTTPGYQGTPVGHEPGTSGYGHAPGSYGPGTSGYGSGPGGYDPATPSYQQGTPGAYQPPPPPGGGGWQAPSSAYYTGGAPTANTKATWALVLAIVSIVPGWVFALGIFSAIPAIILGAQAKGAAERGEVVGGLGLAKGAIWTGVLAIVLGIGFWVLIGIDISNDP